MECEFKHKTEIKWMIFIIFFNSKTCHNLCLWAKAFVSLCIQTLRLYQRQVVPLVPDNCLSHIALAKNIFMNDMSHFSSRISSAI